MATVFIPTPLRHLTGGEAKIAVEGATIAEAMASISEHYPGFDDKLVGDDGEVKRFIKVFVNNTEISTLKGIQTPVAPDDEISIVPAMAGG